jgi:hypothetical protein
VLEVYHKKNRSVKAPNPNTLQSHRVPTRGSHVSAAADRSRSFGNNSRTTHGNSSNARTVKSRTHGNSSRISADGAHDSHMAADGSRGLNGSDGSRNGPRARDGSGVSARAVPDVEADLDNDHDGDVSDNGAPSRAPRNSNSKSHVPKPSQLGFYSGTWVDVLIYARNGYRKLIHTKDPFPERNLENLQVAQNILLEAISDYIEINGRLDEGLYLFFRFGNSLTKT